MEKTGWDQGPGGLKIYSHEMGAHNLILRDSGRQPKRANDNL